MSKTTIVVDTVTLEFLNYWPSTTTNPLTVIGPNPQVALETSGDPSVLMAVRDPEGNVTLTEDPVKLAAKAEAQKSQNRIKRNQLLAQSDWSTLSDVPLANKDEWVSYRALLRAVDLTNPVWPQEPQVVWNQEPSS